MTRQGGMHVGYITIQDAMQRLGVSDKTLRRWIAAKKIPSKRASDGRILVQVDAQQGDDTPSLEERIAVLEAQGRDMHARMDNLEDALVTLRRQPRPIRRMAGKLPR